MTSHDRHDLTREIISNASIPFRRNTNSSSSTATVSDFVGTATRPIGQHSRPTLTAEPEVVANDTLAGQKRSPPEGVDTHPVQNPHSPKRPRHVRLTSTGHEGGVRGREISLPRSPVSLARLRSSSPAALSFYEAAETMLNRSEELGGNKTTKLGRGLPTSPTPARPSPRFPSTTTPRSDKSFTTQNTYSSRRDSVASQVFDSVGLAEFFQQDESPVFVLDVEAAVGDGLPIVFTNTSLRQMPTLFESIHGKLHDVALLPDISMEWYDFRTWVLSPEDPLHTRSPFAFCGFSWSVKTLRRRLRVVSGKLIQSSPSISEAAQNGLRPNLQTYQQLVSSTSSQQTPKKNQGFGYFDVRPTSRTETPGTMEQLVAATVSDVDLDQEIPVENASVGAPTSVSHGDSAMHDLLRGSISPIESVDEIPQRLVSQQVDHESFQTQRMNYLSDKGFFDWTRLPMSPSLPEHIQFAKNFNWVNTSLGPIEEWPADLRAMCNLIMASPHPAAMYWGPDHVAIYNESYIMLAGSKHPELMGSRYQDAWKEIWHVICDVFKVAMDQAQATMKDDDCLFILRSGILEETYFSWSIIPLIGDDGSVVGLYNPAFEKTRRKIAERRMLTLREIGEKTGAAQAVADFWALLIQGFEYNEYDAPLVVVYSLNESEDSDGASSTSSTTAASKQCRLEGILGAPRGHPCAPEIIDLKNDVRGFGSVFKRAINTEKPIVLNTEDGTLDMSLLEDIEWRGFGDPSRTVVIAPIRPTTGESTLGFIVMATNPRRPYDEDYDLFVQLLMRQLATSIASVVLFEDEIRKGERAAQIAAQDRIDLTNQLAVRTQEAVESENKFTRMAELAPVGMFTGDEKGSITFANDAWYRISSYPDGRFVGNDWVDYIRDEDQKGVRVIWASMLQKKIPISIEFRFKTPWKDKFGNSHDTWVLASASPELDEDGDIKRIYGSVTDISSQKMAEVLQRKRMEEAITLKQQQERYIDTTSHEMRNPLSAILQSADALTGSLAELKATETFAASYLESIDAMIESAQTITLCAQHQKRIVDDVLTLSKLDSAMLLVTPIDTQPEVIARRTVKIFEGESQTVDIQLSVQVDKSYRELNVDYVRLDPTRLSQVLINLMTNAIKFTTTQEKRLIKMHIAASRERPSADSSYGLTYIPSQAPKERDVAAGPAWGLGESLYIHFAVSDTGRGLDDFEKKQLFQRFSQANPRTHVTYGGSGLGLFISRELVELQGGEIGVASEAGKGSTFAFYVKCRRSQAPVSGSDEDIMDLHHIADRKSSASSNQKSRLTQLKTTIADHTPESALISPNSTAKTLSIMRSDAAGLRVLIVEDNLINQKVLAAQLKKLGCVVSVANHGGEAIDQIKLTSFYKYSGLVQPQEEIDIVLMDLEMPVMDGVTCVRTLRAMQKSGELVRHIPVIAVTANAREEQIKSTLDAGIDDVVSKPFRIPELVPKMTANIARFAIGSDGDSDKHASDDIKDDVSPRQSVSG